MVVINPGESIQDAIDSLPPEGGTIELAVGTHTPSASINIIDRTNITLRGTGASMNDTEIVYSGFPTYDAIFIRNSSDIRIENLYIHTDQPTGPPGRDYIRGIFVWGESENISLSKLRLEKLSAGVASVWDIHVPERSNYNLTVSDCIIHNNYHGIIYTHTHNSTIRNCKVSDSYGDVNIQLNSYNTYNLIENNEVWGGSDGLMVYSGCNGNTFKGNIVHHCRRGMNVWGGGESTVSKITNNIFYANNMDGIYILAAYRLTKTLVKNNLIYSNGGYGIRINPMSGEMTDQEILIESNTIFSNAADGILYDTPQNLTIKNNIITNNTRYGINWLNGTLTHSYNDVWNNIAGNYNGIPAGIGDISVDPLFVDSVGGDFHLKSMGGHWSPVGWIIDAVKSPCIDAGDPEDDYSKEPTPNGGRINMGAYGNTMQASKSWFEECPQPKSLYTHNAQPCI